MQKGSMLQEKLITSNMQKRRRLAHRKHKQPEIVLQKELRQTIRWAGHPVTEEAGEEEAPFVEVIAAAKEDPNQAPLPLQALIKDCVRR